ncbi:hypothetical protein SCALM49S_01631 [Streptomyces californicus]
MAVGPRDSADRHRFDMIIGHPGRGRSARRRGSYEGCRGHAPREARGGYLTVTLNTALGT